jgi:hypothetical protein
VLNRGGKLGLAPPETEAEGNADLIRAACALTA